MLRRQGWDVIHLGADVPVTDFDRTIEGLQPDLVIVSAQLFHTAAAIKDVAQSTDALLAFGGRAFNLMPDLKDYIPGFFLGESLDAAVETTTRLLSTRPNRPESRLQDQAYQEANSYYAERRSLVEAHVWGTFIATNKPTQYLASINDDISQIISAALKLGNIYLLGTEDNDPNHSSLDKTCPAMLQGDHRLMRGIIFFNHLCAYYDCSNHQVVFVDGVAHSGHDMFNSPEGRNAIFFD